MRNQKTAKLVKFIFFILINYFEKIGKNEIETQLEPVNQGCYFIILKERKVFN